MKSLLTALVLVALVGPRVLGAEPEKPAPEKGTPDKALTPKEAIDKMGQTVTVEMLVKSTKIAKDHCYLDSAGGFNDTHNLALLIGKEAMAKFKESGIDNPAVQFKGKTVRAHGKVTHYGIHPEIKLTGPDDIQIVESKEASPGK